MVNGLLRCPCGNPVPLADCCGRWLAGHEYLQAPDTQALMRSRYSACVLVRHDYLLCTWHASTRPLSINVEPGLRWLGLQVRQHQWVNASHATVEFVARSKRARRAQRLHETSRFANEGGRWFYP